MREAGSRSTRNVVGAREHQCRHGRLLRGISEGQEPVRQQRHSAGCRDWHYQLVRHDIWDHDLSAAPILVTLGSGANERDAVVQLTKMGLTFVLDRARGEPTFPVHDLAVPNSDVPGEETWRTQPFPLKPPPLGRIGITEADLTNITPEAREHALREFRNYRWGSI